MKVFLSQPKFTKIYSYLSSFLWYYLWNWIQCSSQGFINIKQGNTTTLCLPNNVYIISFQHICFFHSSMILLAHWLIFDLSFKIIKAKKKKKKELEKIAKDNNSTIYTESMNYLECHNWSTVFWDPKLGVWAVWVQVEKEKHAFLNGD